MRPFALAGRLRFAALPLLTSILAADGTVPATAELRGAVTGPAREGVLLRLRGQDQGEVRTLRTGPRGEYRFLAVRPGTYTLTAEAPGLATVVLKDLALRVGSSATLDLPMVREAEGSVAVRAQPFLADPGRTAQAQVVPAEQIQDLPIGRRIFTDLSLTTPGVVRQNAPVDWGAPASDLSVNGGNPRMNNFQVDGLDNNDRGNGTLRGAISQEAVQEFQVLTGTYAAEYGRATGGIVNTVTRSGGNAFAGSVFAFTSPGSLAADSPQGATSGDFRLSQFGATAGGAVVADRLFYFASVERTVRQDSRTVTVDPTVAAVLGAQGFPVADGTSPYRETQTMGLFKVDFLQSPGSRWEFRLVAGQGSNGSQIPYGGLEAATNGAASGSRDWTASLGHRWLGDAWVNDLRVMHAVRDYDLSSQDPAGGVQVVLLGMATAGTQRLADQSTHAAYDQIKDTLLFTLGAHTFTTGVDYLRTSNQGRVAQNFKGIYQFQAIPQLGVPSALADFLAPNPFGGTGLPVAFVQSFGDPWTRFQTGSLALFAQDDWALGDALVLKAGLRYDREDLPTFPASADYQALANPPATVDPANGPTRLPDGPYPYASLLAPCTAWSSARVAPRLALSWRIAPAWRFSGGWGVYYGSTNLGPLMGARVYNGSAVQTAFRTVLDNPLAGPWIAWANGDGLAQDHRYAAMPPGLSTIVLPGAVSMPESRQGSAALEWTPAPDQVVTLTVVGSRGTHFLNTRDVNAYVPYLPEGAAAPVLRRPDLRYGSIQRIDATGETRYLGETLQWRWRPERNLDLDVHYTHSKAEDNFIDWNPDFTVQNTFDPGQEWGPSYQDQTHRAVAAVTWRSGADRGPWLRDWTLATVARWESGRPYTILAGYDRNANGDGTSDRPAGVGRNSATTPSFSNVDLRVSRGFQAARVRLDLMVDVFNLFNTTQVEAVQNDLASTLPAFGTPVAYYAKRQVQFGLRAAF